MVKKQKFFDDKGHVVAEMTMEEINNVILEIDDIGRKYALGVMPYKEAVMKLSKINPFNLSIAYISLLELYRKEIEHQALKREKVEGGGVKP